MMWACLLGFPTLTLNLQGPDVYKKASNETIVRTREKSFRVLSLEYIYLWLVSSWIFLDENFQPWILRWHLLWVTWTKICPQDKLSSNQKQVKRSQCTHSLIIGCVVFTLFHQWGEGSCAAQVNAKRLSFLWTIILFVPSKHFSLPMTSVGGSLTLEFCCGGPSSLKHFSVLNKRDRSKKTTKTIKPLLEVLLERLPSSICNATESYVQYQTICSFWCVIIHYLQYSISTLYKALNLALPSARFSSTSP